MSPMFGAAPSIEAINYPQVKLPLRDWKAEQSLWLRLGQKSDVNNTKEEGPWWTPQIFRWDTRSESESEIDQLS